MKPSHIIAFGSLLGLFLGACTPASSGNSRAPALTASITPSRQDQPAVDPLPGQAIAPVATNTPMLPPPTTLPTRLPDLRTPSPTPLPCWSQGGRLERSQVPSELLPNPLEVRVYMPPCYDDEPGRRYPALYLLHGQSFNDDQWDRLGADETADALVASGIASPFIIVMPRDRACCIQPDKDAFGEAVAQELVPWVDGQYRTLPDRLFRAVGGLSRGAGWAVHIGLSHWDLFGAIGAHSLPVFWVDTYYIKSWLDAIPADQMPRFYLDNPDSDRPEIMDSSVWFEDLLTRRGIPHEWHLFTGYHEESYWQAHLEDYLLWYVSAWR